MPATTANSAPGARRILVWDLPTRAFHWLLALSFTGAVLTAETRFHEVHVTFGYTVFGLILFRLLWGLVGPRYARFASFAFGPRRVLAYLGSILRGRPEHHVGHNPAGSWAIYALLGLGLAAGAMGMVANSDFGSHWVGEFHEGLAATMLALVTIHLCGVVVSSFVHRENLARGMLDGRKRGELWQSLRRPRSLVAAALVAGVLAFWVQQANDAATAPVPAAERHHDH